jgi:hypothetical protein
MSHSDSAARLARELIRDKLLSEIDNPHSPEWAIRESDEVALLCLKAIKESTEIHLSIHRTKRKS